MSARHRSAHAHVCVGICTFVLVSKYFCTTAMPLHLQLKSGGSSGVEITSPLSAWTVRIWRCPVSLHSPVSIYTFVLASKYLCTSQASEPVSLHVIWPRKPRPSFGCRRSLGVSICTFVPVKQVNWAPEQAWLLVRSSSGVSICTFSTSKASKLSTCPGTTLTNSYAGLQTTSTICWAH